MKTIHNFLKPFQLFQMRLWALLMAIFLMACQKEEEKIIMDSSAAPTISLSSATVVLSKEKPSETALTVTWVEPNYGFASAPTYNVMIDKKGGDFTKAVNVAAGSALKKEFTNAELNTILLNIGLPAGSASDVDVKVMSVLATKTTAGSAVSTLKATPYSNKLDLSTTWGVVGSAANNWGATPDLPFYKTSVANELVAYVTLVDGEIKFRQNNDWAVNLGSNKGSTSQTALNGDNIAVKAGSYKITLNPVANTYKIEKFSWGVVGSAANDWGATPDLPLMYDPTVDYWRGVVTLKDGEMKIRANNDWGTNFGGSNGTLVAGGDNIVVKKGTYLITADFNKLKYTITPYAPWGIVGAATKTGWGTLPDQKFTYDLSTETWFIKGIVLTADQFKFRLNDDWGTNYGTTAAAAQAIGTAGGLKAGGENFIALPGTYDFELDLKDATKPTYKATKVK
jgi:starch-binding outer membrane protein SusE/F